MLAWCTDGPGLGTLNEPGSWVCGGVSTHARSLGSYWEGRVPGQDTKPLENYPLEAWSGEPMCSRAQELWIDQESGSVSSPSFFLLPSS